MSKRGWENEHLSIWPDETIRQRILDHLRTKIYDCILIGAGIRLSTRRLKEFEMAASAAIC